MNQARKKAYLYVGAFIALLFAPLYFGESYFSGEIRKASDNIVNAKKEMNQINIKNGQLSDSRVRYQEIKGKIDEASEVVINKGEIVGFITELEHSAKSNNVKLEKKSINKEDVSSSYIGYSFFSVKAGGNFDDVMQFLYSLENFPYYINIENIKMSYGDFDEYSRGIVILDLTVKVYQKEK
ncbi:MAG: type 4a pilus biogenesis protein PilO [Candidatus Pacebacteria bacterium]|nr:type 4a pilus biogenesis protein PilO [Candidatus Paceibacterota bacterium]